MRDGREGAEKGQGRAGQCEERLREGEGCGVLGEGRRKETLEEKR